MREAVCGRSRKEFRVQCVKRSLVGTERFIGDVDERRVNQAEVFGQRGLGCVKVEQAGDVFFAGFSGVEGGQGGHGITGVVLGRNGLQSDGGTVVKGDVSEVTLRNFNLLHGVEVRDVVRHVGVISFSFT